MARKDEYIQVFSF